MPIHIKPTIEASEIIASHYREMNKKRWAKVSTTDRVKHMSELAKKRWSKKTKNERSEYLKSIGFAGLHTKKGGRKPVPDRKTSPKGL